MERQRFVVNGGIRMPIGFRFRPTDEELVTHYLKRKALNLPLPASVIPEFNVFQTDPWRLPGDMNEKKRYFFGHCGKVNASDNNNCRIATGSGYWRTIGKPKMVVAPRSNQVIGTRQAFVFMQKKHPQGPKTRWFLHQFCLLGPSTSTPKPTQVEMQDWVVHSLFQKKRKAKKMEKSSKKVATPQASPCSSGVTGEHCSNEVASTLDQEASSFKSV